MDETHDEKLNKRFRTIFIGVLILGVLASLYYHLVYAPQKKKEFILQHTPKIVEQRSYLTAEESQEMKAAYEELMLKKKKTSDMNVPVLP